MDATKCVVCQSTTDEKLSNIGQEGLVSLIDYAKICQPNIVTHLEGVLSTNVDGPSSLKIHRSCQKNVFNKLRKKRTSIEKGKATAAKKSKVTTRSFVPQFDWKSNCLFCAKPCSEVSSKHPDRADIHRGEYKLFRDVILEKCKAMDDEEAQAIERRVLSCSDFVAAEARYHGSCRDIFNINSTKNSIFAEKGRPIPESDKINFDCLCDWLETEGVLHTLAELEDKLKEITGSSDVYSTRTIQRKLLEKYGSNIYFNEVKGRRNVVCFRNTASILINDMWYENRKKDLDKEAERIIKMAAKLIVSDIRDKEYDCEYYPNNESISSLEENLSWLPPKLRLFMEMCVRSPLKQASIGQCLTHATRPGCTLPPILFALAIELDHVFGSRWIVDLLKKLGFSLSYDEITRFKQSVVVNEDANAWLKRNMEGAFHHWIADNVDHNVKTLDGKGTLHAMGIIVATTGAHAPYSDLPKIPRQKLMKVSQLVQNKGVPIKAYIAPNITGLSKVFLKPLAELKNAFASPDSVKMNLLWHTAHFFKKCRPGWSGYMSDVSVGQHDGKADFTMLPIIDLDPNDMSCIYSTVMFIINQAQTLNVKTLCLTFDQPLWLKAMEIVKAKSLEMVLILGGFHTMMSFAGSIGALMDGSGFAECLQTVFGSSTVPKIMDGKAIARALRAHFITEASLTTILLSGFIPATANDDDSIPDTSGEDCDILEEYDEEKDYESFEQNDALIDLDTSQLRKLKEDEVDELKDIYECLEKDYDEGMRRLHSSPTFNLVSNMLEKLKEELQNHSRTAKLWLDYMGYVNVLKQFIRAERCGDWDLHLNALEKMLNLFAATGHLNYAKCARLHLQEMRELKTKFPFVHQCFKEKGYHTVRRSNKFWAGLWTDLIIEQVLMRSIKSRGGITRGCGISESVRLVWLGSMHRRGGVHDAMSTLTMLKRVSSEQHVELTTSRRQRDMGDMNSFTSWLECHNPFDTTSKELRSISSGLTASEEDNINCDEAEIIGLKLHEKLDGVCFENITMKRSEKIRSLALLREGVKVQNEKVVIDPLVLFGRLSILVQKQEDVAAQFKYELTPEPSALFKDGLMRKPTKSALRQYLVKDSPYCKEKSQFTVIDGGALLYQVPWLPNSTYSDIANQYKDHVLEKYGDGRNICVIFDGYDDPLSTKAHEHVRRSGLCSSDVNISDSSMKVTMTRKLFLKNTNNKKELIKILSSKLPENGIKTDQSEGDADVLTAKKALEVALSQQVTVVSDDTDVLVLLMYHWHLTISPGCK